MGDLRRRGLAAVSALVVALAGCGGGSAKEDAAPKVNGAPMALAAASAEASFGEMVTLDGGASSDPDGDALTYDWTQTAGPPVSLAAQGALALFQAPSFVGTLRFELTVRDPVGATSVTEARVLVLADKRKAVFVAKEGLDTAAGTRGEPLATVGAAIAKAAGASGGGVYVAAGQYDEGLALESGVSIYGGFQPGTWLRDPTAFVTTIAGGPTAVVVAGKSGIVLDGLEIRSGDAADAGGSSAAVLVANSIDVRLQGCRLKAGLGGSGSAGLAGSAGGGGGGGAPGANARTSCNALVPGGGGGGGTAQFGGGGGAGGCGTAAGQRGGVGYGGTSGGAGSPYLSGVAGSPGASGASGVAGAAGASGAAFGAVDASGYLAASGPPGAPGGFGNGGGGGGGGAGYYSFLTGAYAGAGGGGGGAGGDGGGAGGGGGGGGGSFGVILYASTGVVIADVGIVTGGGGAGGDGALGGLGGAGGAGGPGGFVSSAYVTAGGAGGYGGAGGDGGGGGGGGGGPSIGIVEDAASSATRQNVTVELGAAGAGGAGPGASGAGGLQASYVKR